MHYRNFTVYDTATYVAIGLALYAILQLLLSRAGRPAWQPGVLFSCLLIGVVLTLLSTLLYGETLTANGVSRDLPVRRVGFPRFVYEQPQGPDAALFGEGARLYWQYFVENTLIYTAGALVVASVVNLLRSA